MRGGRAGVLVAVLLAAAACQPMPRPFQPESKVSAPDKLVDLGARAGVLVAPVAGAPAEVSERLGALLAAHLRDRDIPATTEESGARSYVLRGAARTARLTDSQALLTIDWRLDDPFGTEVGAFKQLRQVRTAEWQDGAPALLAFVAELAAPRIDELLGAPGAPPPPVPLSAVFVAPVDGAPGDGRESLTRAIRAALARSRVPVIEEIADDAYLVLGSVHVEEAGAARQTVEVYWTVIEPNGRQIGVVSQSNEVDRGALDGPWGGLAEAVAEGGADGIVDILEAVGPLPESAADG